MTSGSGRWAASSRPSVLMKQDAESGATWIAGRNGIIETGMAIAGKYRKKDYDVFVIAGDGELQEGICWEGINLAAAKKLDHMIVFVDKNGWQSGVRGRDRLQQYNRKVRCKLILLRRLT
ncbi:MAG: thiamine pyrophosphate-dependent enzyme [[Clostridium] scindens]